MKKWMRLFVLALLAACMFALTSCGGGEAGDGAGKAFVPSAIRYTAAPAAAFGGTENARVIAVSADRQKLLITSPFDLYIWDVGAGARIPVSFSAEEDLDQLELNMNRVLTLGPNNKKLTEEQMEKRLEAGKDYLTKQNQTRFTNVAKKSRIFAPENKKITIMTQILVTLNEDATTLHVRKAIELLRGVVSTTVLKTKGVTNDKTLRQQKYVKESLERAFDEVEQARRESTR